MTLPTSKPISTARAPRGWTPKRSVKAAAGAMSKIHRVVDSFALPFIFEVTGAPVADGSAAPELLVPVSKAGTVVGDKGCDSEKVRQQTREDSQPVISRRRGSAKGNDDLERDLYRYRHLIENLFAKLKHYRGLARRFDKLKKHY